jgi:predicted dehydrogenase
MDKLNVALVGCGIFGQTHASTYARYHKSELVAVCDLDETRARETAEKYGCRATTSIEDIAADDSIQAVSVVVPDFAHLDPCLTLARAGKHLLVEKPLATSVAEAEAIVRAVADAGVTCMIDFHNRYNPAFISVKERLASGELGTPQMMVASLSDRIEVATEWFGWSGRTGPEWFLGSHIADLACWLFDDYPVSVFAEGRKDVLASRGIDCYDVMQIHLSFKKGMATLQTSWIVPKGWPTICDFWVSLQATEGRADVRLANQGVTIADSRGNLDWPFLIGGMPVGEEEFGFCQLPIRDFVRAVLEGRPAPVPVAEGLKNVKIIAAALESAKENRVVEVKL